MTDHVDFREHMERHARHHASGRATVEGARNAWLQNASGRVNIAAWAETDPPEREWLVEGLIPMHAVTLFSGDGGTGKSLMMFQLACAVVRGVAWFGREVRPGPRDRRAAARRERRA